MNLLVAFACVITFLGSVMQAGECDIKQSATLPLSIPQNKSDRGVLDTFSHERTRGLGVIRKIVAINTSDVCYGLLPCVVFATPKIIKAHSCKRARINDGKIALDSYTAYYDELSYEQLKSSVDKWQDLHTLFQQGVVKKWMSIGGRYTLVKWNVMVFAVALLDWLNKTSLSVSAIGIMAGGKSSLMIAHEVVNLYPKKSHPSQEDNNKQGYCLCDDDQLSVTYYAPQPMVGIVHYDNLFDHQRRRASLCEMLNERMRTLARLWWPWSAAQLIIERNY